MTWRCFRVTYELWSSLHVGYHRVGNLERTRYYLPARNLWGAVTERLTRAGFSTKDVSEGDYPGVGAWVQKHCAFTYFYVCEGNGHVLAPQYTERGLCYGALSMAEFERRYLGSHVTTALDAATTSAESGSLHEVEFIAPHAQDGLRTQLRGLVFLDETARNILGDESRWGEWLGELQVGGERRYGFGRLRHPEFIELIEDNPTWEKCSFVLGNDRPRVQTQSGVSLLAHVRADGVAARGQIEPLVWRETDRSDSTRFGVRLTSAAVCWAPGSVLEQPATFTVKPSGIWEAECPSCSD
ncbi:MAG: hypothetical protein GX601_12255 [Anaerolineales bacterium]|nr:hypothetical protein [Anaerolineales bacterium]